MTKEEFDKRYPIKITQIVSEVSDIMKICLFNKDKKKLASIVESDNVTYVLGDMDVKWLVAFNCRIDFIGKSIQNHGKNEQWWAPYVLSSTYPIMDDMVEPDEVRKVMNGILSKNGKQIYNNATIRSYWTDALSDVSKLLKTRDMEKPDEEASEIINRCRHWDEQFIRSLDLLEYTLMEDGKN